MPWNLQPGTGGPGGPGGCSAGGLGGIRVLWGSIISGLSGQSGLNDKIGISGQGGINDQSGQGGQEQKQVQGQEQEQEREQEQEHEQGRLWVDHSAPSTCTCGRIGRASTSPARCCRGCRLTSFHRYLSGFYAYISH